MTEETDPLDTLLSKWESPEPTAALDRRVISAYRAAVQPPVPVWRRFWISRISVPAPALVLAAIAIVALLFLWRPTPAPVAATPGAVTHLNISGFQPLPEGAARVIPAMEIKK